MKNANSGTTLVNTNSFSNLSVRPMVEADISCLQTMDRLSHLTPWSEAQFKQCLIPPNESLVLQKNQSILGFAVSRLVLDEAELLNLVIDEPYQGQKLGQFLLTCICSKLQDKGASCLFLEVRCSNKPAIKLYERLDFHCISRRKNYYPTASSREDALVFRKDF